MIFQKQHVIALLESPCKYKITQLNLIDMKNLAQ